MHDYIILTLKGLHLMQKTTKYPLIISVLRFAERKHFLWQELNVTLSKVAFFYAFKQIIIKQKDHWEEDAFNSASACPCILRIL